MSPTDEAKRRLIWLSLGIGCVAFAAYGSLVPFDYTSRGFTDAWRAFVESGRHMSKLSRVDLGINVMLMIPAGYFLMAGAVPSSTSVGGRLTRSLLVLVACFICSVLIEFSQNWFPPRIPMVSDVAAQTVGALGGIILWWLVGRRVDRLFAGMSAHDARHNRLGLVLLLYVAGLTFTSLAPLDLTLHPTELWSKYRRGRILFVPFSWDAGSAFQMIYNLVVDVFLFVPVGVFGATFLAPREGPARSFSQSFLIGFAVVAGIEALQLPVMSRVVDSTDLITGSCGVAIGVLLYRFFASHSPTAERQYRFDNSTIVLAVVAYSVLPILVFWQPFQFNTLDSSDARDRAADFFGIPLARALAGSYLMAFDGFLRKLLLFAPFGFLIAILAERYAAGTRSLVVGLAFSTVLGLALVIELGQLLQPEHLAAFDDALICVFGAACGYLITKRLRR